ncbi:hypothetical protein [Seleniivibrio woodruffii]|uniref:hypothetical protein n=1 Tax=Seleniivibrio woodruffii TaxID=1078050 RepID=UPI0026F1A256|nr:hypothetical protein [Seleniivibrio woodruffii]
MVNRHLSPEFSDSLVVFLYQHTNELINRILTYSIELKFSLYTSTHREAWRASINGLNDVIKDYIENYSVTPEIFCRETGATDAASAFGIAEARKHFERGVSLKMFLGLYKYYVWAYLDTLEDFGGSEEEKALAREFIIKIFSRIEYYLIAEWISQLQEKAPEGFPAEE